MALFSRKPARPIIRSTTKTISSLSGVQPHRHLKKPGPGQLTKFWTGLTGLISWRFLIIILLFVAVVGFVYAPGPWRIQTVNITGTSSSELHRLVTEKTTEHFQRRGFWPHNHIAFFPSSRFRSEILTLPGVQSVELLSYRWRSHELEIKLTARVPSIQVATGSQFLTLDERGELLALTTEPATATKLTLQMPVSVSPVYGQAVLVAKSIQWLTDFTSAWSDTVPTSYTFKSRGLKTDPAPSLPVTLPETAMVFTRPEHAAISPAAEFWFDMSAATPNEQVKRAQVFWKNLSDDEKNRLIYADFRLADRVFACYNGQPCVQPASQTP